MIIFSEKVYPPVRNELYNYQNYRDLISNSFDRFMGAIAKTRSGVNKARPEQIFWELVDGKEPNEYEPYLYLTKSLAYGINLEILIKQKKISVEWLEIQNIWWEYLIEKLFLIIFPSITPQFLKEVTEQYPVTKQLQSLYEIVTETRLPGSLLDLVNKNAKIVDLWNDFVLEYKYAYNIFEKYCVLIGEKLGEVLDKDLKHLITIFNLIPTNSEDSSLVGERTPTGKYFKLNEILNNLRHVKNSIISHDNYIFEENNSVRIIDKNNSGKITFNLIYTVPMLYNLIYGLNVLTGGLQRASSLCLFLKMWDIYFAKINKK